MHPPVLPSRSGIWSFHCQLWKAIIAVLATKEQTNTFCGSADFPRGVEQLVGSSDLYSESPITFTFGRVLLRVRMLYYLKAEVLGEAADKAFEGISAKYVTLVFWIVVWSSRLMHTVLETGLSCRTVMQICFLYSQRIVELCACIYFSFYYIWKRSVWTF